MRPPGYETLDRNGANRPYEQLGEHAHGTAALFPRRNAAAYSQRQDDDGSDDLRRMRLRLLELTAP
jgi:hypothetical protein